MSLSLCILTLFMIITPAAAGNVSQQPDPELLRRFEAERDAAREDQRRADDLRKQGEEKIQRAKQMRQQSDEKAIRELCAIGALPASDCP
jgi:hypothetical protein